MVSTIIETTKGEENDWINTYANSIKSILQVL